MTWFPTTFFESSVIEVVILYHTLLDIHVISALKSNLQEDQVIYSFHKVTCFIDPSHVKF